MLNPNFFNYERLNFLQQDFVIDLRNGCGPSDAKLQ